MKIETPFKHAPVERRPFSVVLIGGLAMHGQIDAAAITARGAAMGLDTDAQARAVLDLINRGLASVSRVGAEGHLLATAEIAALDQAYRVRAIVAYLAAGKKWGCPHE